MFTKKQYAVPTKYPAAVTFRTGNGEESVELMVVDQDSYAAFARNVGSLDAGKIMARKTSNDAPFTADDFAKSLKDGAEFRGELANDGDATSCGLCLQTFQPKIIPYNNADGTKGEGGNHLILKTAQIAGLVEKLGERGKQVNDLANATTASIMGGPSELKAIALPVCPSCRKARKDAGYMERFYSRASAAVMLPTVDQKIQEAGKRREIQDNAAAVSQALGGFRPNRPQQHATDSGPAFRRPGNNDRDRRPEKPKVDWHGVQLEVPTANAFKAAVTDGKVGDSISAILALTEEQMCEMGLAHAGSVKAIRFVLNRGLEGRTVVGEAKSAAPGARPQVGGKKPVKKGGKRNIDVSPDRASRGGSVSLQNAF
jgi:hypothetical protein